MILIIIWAYLLNVKAKPLYNEVMNNWDSDTFISDGKKLLLLVATIRKIRYASIVEFLIEIIIVLFLL